MPGPADVPPPPSRGQVLAVVLESGDVVGGGLQAQDEAEFVVDLDRGFAETMLEAGGLRIDCRSLGRVGQ